MFNVLLQVLDDGRLTDGQGRTVDFTNAVLIMTSNLPGDPADFFKPEFINRVDDIIRFRSLTEEDLTEIVRIQLDVLETPPRGPPHQAGGHAGGRGAHRHGRLRPAYGARPLKRVIQRGSATARGGAARRQVRRGRHHRGRRRGTAAWTTRATPRRHPRPTADHLPVLASVAPLSGHC